MSLDIGVCRASYRSRLLAHPKNTYSRLPFRSSLPWSRQPLPYERYCAPLRSFFESSTLAPGTNQDKSGQQDATIVNEYRFIRIWVELELSVIGSIPDSHSATEQNVIIIIIEDGDDLASPELILHRIASCAAFDAEDGDRSDENPDRSQSRPKSPAQAHSEADFHEHGPLDAKLES